MLLKFCSNDALSPQVEARSTIQMLGCHVLSDYVLRVRHLVYEFMALDRPHHGV